MGKKNNRLLGVDAGFTLIEIAIVVVIIGLLLGGILKGQEMIRNARSHNVADQGNAVKAALLGYQDRFRALPGDDADAADNLIGLGTDMGKCTAAATNLPTGKTVDDLKEGNGDGNSRIGGEPDEAANAQNYCERPNEIALVWRHLAAAGFLSGNFVGDSTAVDEAQFNCQVGTCIIDAFNGGLMLHYDYQQYSNASDKEEGATPKTDGKSNQLTTGRFIPVEIVSELDRKVDDGDPSTGSFRVADFFVNGDGKATTTSNSCVADKENVGLAAEGLVTGVDHYNIASQNTDCGGVYLF